MTLEEYVALEAAAVSTDERKSMPDSDFAVPSKRALIIKDANHVKLAWDMVDRTQGLTDAERSEARSRILRKAKDLGVDTSDWKHTMNASAVSFSFADTGANPNKMPFKGVVTYFDAPSDSPPGGAGGLKVMIPSMVGIPALDSLKGMGVNLAAESDKHEVTHKVGVITDAYTGVLTAKGLEVIVEGHIFARDFPREASMVKLNQSSLGFSYETANTLLASQEIGGEEIAVVQSLVFTGAAILLKQSAAYKHTSIAAFEKPKEDIINVAKEELQALFGEFKTDILASVETKVQAAMEYAATKKDDEEEDDADALQQAQVANPNAGVPEVKPEAQANVKGDVTASTIADAVKAAVAEALKGNVTASATPEAPARKSVVHAGSLMAKYGVDASATNLTAAIDTVAASGLSNTDSIAMKLEGIRNGQIKY